METVAYRDGVIGMHAPRLANTPASRSSQTAQASPKGLLRLARATESNAAKRYDVECKKILCGLVLQSTGWEIVVSGCMKKDVEPGAFKMK